MAHPPPPPDANRVVSAARNAPLKRTITGESLKAGATDGVLNSVGALGDLVGELKSSDKFFRYKAVVAVIWFALSVTSVGIACPSIGGPSNSYGARLVIAGDSKTPIYMVKNDGASVWQDVEVIVNGKFKSTDAQIDLNREMTLSPVMLFDAAGGRAPADLKITDITVQVNGGDKVTLLEGGVTRSP